MLIFRKQRFLHPKNLLQNDVLGIRITNTEFLKIANEYLKNNKVISHEKRK